MVSRVLTDFPRRFFLKNTEEGKRPETFAGCDQSKGKGPKTDKILGLKTHSRNNGSPGHGGTAMSLFDHVLPLFLLGTAYFLLFSSKR